MDEIPEIYGHFFLLLLIVISLYDSRNMCRDVQENANVESSRDVVKCAPPDCCGVANAESGVCAKYNLFCIRFISTPLVNV